MQVLLHAEIKTALRGRMGVFMENLTNYEPVAYLPEDKAARFAEFLTFSGIEDVSNEPDELSGSFVVSTTQADFEKAKNLLNIFSENELEDSEDNSSESSKKVNLYESSADKYSDNLSSAITFLICGIVGLAILVLNDLNIIKLFSTSGASFILTNAVLGCLFIIFLIIGIKSLKYSKDIKSQLAHENEEISKITDWLENNVTKDMIEESYDNGIPEEMKYFSRSEYLKKAVRKEFSETEDGILETVTDNYIEQLFS